MNNATAVFAPNWYATSTVGGSRGGADVGAATIHDPGPERRNSGPARRHRWKYRRLGRKVRRGNGQDPLGHRATERGTHQDAREMLDVKC